jgi:antitoxin VapB
MHTENPSNKQEGHPVRLFRNGCTQAIRIPREFELPGEKAMIRKEGERLIIEPIKKRSLADLLASWEPLDEDSPEIEDLPPEDDVDF